VCVEAKSEVHGVPLALGRQEESGSWKGVMGYVHVVRDASGSWKREEE